jgi:hypothetical protein
MNYVILSLIVISFLTIGCAIEPIPNYILSFSKPEVFSSDFSGTIVIKDLTGYDQKAIDYVPKIDKQIVHEIKSFGKTFIENSNGPQFVFTYFPCLFVDYFPTQIPPINGVLHFFTFGFYPIGAHYKCKVDLDVIDPTGKLQNKNYSIEIAAQKGGVGLFSAASNMTGVAQIRRVRFPARLLLQKYQLELTNEVSAKTVH